MKKLNKKKVLIIVIFVFICFIIYQAFLKEKKPDFETAEVIRGSISEEIFESGQIRKGEKINLAFKNSGRIKEIYVKENQEVEAGQLLATLDTTDLEFQLEEARASLRIAELNLEKLLEGGTPEEIKIAERQTENARIAFESAEKNLQDSYQSALTVLDSAYPQIYNALNFARDFTKDVTIYDEDAKKIISARDEIERAGEKAKDYLIEAKQEFTNQAIEEALLIMEDNLRIAFDNLETMRQTAEGSAIHDNMDRVLLDLYKTNINTALGQVLAARQNISSLKLQLASAETSLQETEERLALVKGAAQPLDIELLETQIKQAESRVRLYENQIKHSNLTSPINGKVAEVKKRQGELAQPSPQDIVIVLLPAVPYEIKVDIYEENIVKIAEGNPVEISLIAFPNKTFKGRVTSISSAEKLIYEVVYYETIISFEETPAEIKPGMTADLIIQINEKQDVLIIPRQALRQKNGQSIVEIINNGLIEEKKVLIGLRGDNFIEIISGLEEGQKVIIR